MGRKSVMKKVLVYRIKHGQFADRTIVWDVSSLQSRNEAYVDLFNIIDSELDAYSDADSVTCALLPLARNQNPEACEALLAYRRNKAGEFFEEVEVRKSKNEPILTNREEKESKTVQMSALSEI